MTLNVSCRSAAAGRLDEDCADGGNNSDGNESPEPGLLSVDVSEAAAENLRKELGSPRFVVHDADANGSSSS